MKAGISYNDEFKQSLYYYVTAKGLSPGSLVAAAKLAKENHDDVLLNLLMPRLLYILNWRVGSESNEFKIRSYETCAFERRDIAALLSGTSEWMPLEQNAFLRLRGHCQESKEDWFSVRVVCFGAKATDLLTLTEELLSVGKRGFRPWVPLMHELSLRGWRFQIYRRRFVVLRRGLEEPRADADFGY